MRWVAAALLVGAAAFCLYHATLLPGFDFGDTGSFQTSVASPLIRARDAYPLYFAIGRVLLRLAPAEPAHALNLASAAQAALACGLIVLVAAELSGSLIALIVERGVSFVSFAGSGRPIRTAYEGNVFAAQPRYLIKIARGMVDP